MENKAGVNNLIINGSANKESDGSVSLQGTSESYGSVKVGKTYNRTTYLIAKCQNYYDDYLGMFTSGITYDRWYYALDIYNYKGKCMLLLMEEILHVIQAVCNIMLQLWC